MLDGMGRRFPRSVYDVGEEPDPRFSLANERTFLAWIRTGLALSAAGVALEALDLDVRPGLRLAAAVVLVVLGAAVPVLAWGRWGSTERALRLGRRLPGSALAPLVAAGAAVAGVLVLAGLLTA
ncbi:YidH family protein [Blastococcus sp. SYSU D00820]